MKTVLKLACCALLSWQAFTTQAGTTVTKISAGGNHSLFTKSDGSLWAMGDNTFGQLGAGFGFSWTNRPQLIVPGNVTTIAAGGAHSLFRQSDGSLWAMGHNGSGQLGDGTTTNHYFPEQIEPSQVGLIAAGNSQSLFAKFHSPFGPGSFWDMGDNNFGDLGDGSTSYTNQPEQILSVPTGTAVSAIAGGGGHSLYVKPDGSLWAMGYNSVGQLGDGSVMDRHLAVTIESSNVTAIAAGALHSLFIKLDGSLWAMGYNLYGQLGDNSITERHMPEQVQFNDVTAVAAGDFHSLFIKSDGSLWAMGYNGFGQLGDGTTNDHHLPVQIVASGVTAIAAGGNHSLFLKSDGSLWGMGANAFYGELGTGTTGDSHVPEMIVAGAAPVITGITLSGTNLVLNATNGFAGRTYFTLMGTNVTQPLAQWSPIATNVLGADGPFTVTATNAVDPNAAQQYYILQLQ